MTESDYCEMVEALARIEQKLDALTAAPAARVELITEEVPRWQRDRQWAET